MDTRGDSDARLAFRHLGHVLQTMNHMKLNLDFIGGVMPLIQKVPAFLRSIQDAERHFDPDLVAIGPCHHRDAHLQSMEDLKKFAAAEFCCSSHQQVQAFYLSVQEVAPQARKSYHASDCDIEGFSDDEFVDMMFYDGCFLLQFMTMQALDRGPPAHWKMPRLSENWVRRIARDILLVENQIPWVVLEALMRLKHVLVDRYIAATISDFDVQWSKPQVDLGEYRPFHLLDLVRHWQLGPVPSRRADEVPRPMLNLSPALELAEVGIHLTASKTARFADIGVGKGLLFGKLWLPPVYLGELTMCWLTNMAAFEMLQGGMSDCGVCSYVQILALLMNRADDVRELRTKRILYPVLSDQQTLDFFKSICKYLPYGHQYERVRQQLSDYHHNRRIRVCLHKFVYNNMKYLLTAGSAFGFLIPILKTVLSLKQDKQNAS